MLEIDRPWHKGKRRNPYDERERKRKIRRWVIALVLLLLIFIGAGALYTWYMGKQKLPDTAIQPAPTPVTRKEMRRGVPADDAVVSIVQQTLTSPIKPPSNAAISIKTNALAACTIIVKMNNSASTDSGLVPKDADEFGIVTWTWTVPAGVVVSPIPVDITCANKKNSAYYHADIVVQ